MSLSGFLISIFRNLVCCVRSFNELLISRFRCLICCLRSFSEFLISIFRHLVCCVRLFNELLVSRSRCLICCVRSLREFLFSRSLHLSSRCKSLFHEPAAETAVRSTAVAAAKIVLMRLIFITSLCSTEWVWKIQIQTCFFRSPFLHPGCPS